MRLLLDGGTESQVMTARHVVLSMWEGPSSKHLPQSVSDKLAVFLCRSVTGGTTAQASGVVSLFADVVIRSLKVDSLIGIED